MTIRVLIVEPGEIARPADIKGDLEDMQKIVGGLIQAVYPWSDRACIVCNDEGKLMGLPFNRALEDYDIIAGTFLVCGLGDENFCGLTDKQMQRYEKMYHYPQYPVREQYGLVHVTESLLASMKEVHYVGGGFACIEFDPEIASLEQITAEMHGKSAVKKKAKIDPER